MIYTMFAYKDKDLEKFNPPMLFPLIQEDAIETVKDGVIKGKIEGAEAFDLYFLGEYDTADASIKLVSEPLKVLTLSQYVRKA